MAQCLRIHVSAAMPQRPELWTLHARAMSLKSKSATRLEDPCVRAHVPASISVNRHGATARAMAQTENRHRATTRRQKSEFQPDLDVSPPIYKIIQNRKKTVFQPDLDVSLPRNAKRAYFGHSPAQAKRGF